MYNRHPHPQGDCLKMQPVVSKNSCFVVPPYQEWNPAVIMQVGCSISQHSVWVLLKYCFKTHNEDPVANVGTELTGSSSLFGSLLHLQLPAAKNPIFTANYRSETQIGGNCLVLCIESLIASCHPAPCNGAGHKSRTSLKPMSGLTAFFTKYCAPHNTQQT